MTHFSTSSARIAKFGRGGVALTSRTPLTAEQIRNAVPSIYAEDKHSSRSERYAFISTGAVLEGLRREGFEPFEIRQGGSKDDDKRGFTKHLIRLRHASCKLQEAGDHTREIVLVNSHDGTSSYRMMGGVFRMVCSNGMVVAEGTLEDVKVKHSGDVVHAVIDGCVQVLGQLPAVSESILEWGSIRLSEGERQAFATAALAMRFEGETPVKPLQLLAPHRREDNTNDLWRTFNVIQENTVRGGIRYNQPVENSHRVRRMRTREVQSVEGNVAINRGLWVLAQEMAKLKA
jgi:hypothetical protein